MSDYYSVTAPANRWVGEQEVAICKTCGAAEPMTPNDHVPNCPVGERERIDPYCLTGEPHD